MSYGDTGAESTDDRGESRSSSDSESGGPVSTLSRYVRRGAESGALAGLGGGVTLVRGLRAIRSGRPVRGLCRLAVGGGLVALAARQRRSKRDAGEQIDIGQSDVVDTAPDIESVGEEPVSRSEHASGDEAKSVVNTSPDIEGVSDESSSRPDHASGDEAQSVVDTGPDIGGIDADTEASDTNEGQTEPTAVAETDEETNHERTAETDRGAATETGEGSAGVPGVSHDRVGAAAFDEHTSEVPAPQQVFNQQYLSLDAEAVWGIRGDDVVVVSQQYDAIEATDSIEYVASTQVDGNRVLTIPDRITDHWDEVAGGGMAVESGDDVVFATSDDPEADWQLLVVPAAWADEILDEDS
jgi:hypothetical protein